MKRRTAITLGRHESTIAMLVVAITLAALLFGVATPARTCVVGDMRLRYAAQIPPALTERYLDAADIGVGLGAAAIQDWDGLGDALALGGRVFVRHTRRGAPLYYRLAANRYFLSNAFVYVPADRGPSGDYSITTATPMDRVVEALARDFPQGVIAAGLLRFAPLRTIAMSAPAISGAAVTQRAVRYYTRPMEETADSWAQVVLVAGRDDERLAALLPPAAMRTLAAGHALALRLRAAPIENLPTRLTENAVAVGQLLKDAVAVEGRLALYPIAQASTCAPGR